MEVYGVRINGNGDQGNVELRVLYCKKRIAPKKGG